MSGTVWPLRRTPRGGLQRSSDTLKARIALAMFPRGTGNPFLALEGVGGPDLTFAPTAPATLSEIRAHAMRVFDRLEQRREARLVSVDFPDTGDASGQLRVVVHYVNLRTGQSDSVALGGGDG